MAGSSYMPVDLVMELLMLAAGAWLVDEEAMRGGTGMGAGRCLTGLDIGPAWSMISSGELCRGQGGNERCRWVGCRLLLRPDSLCVRA